ncbi:PfkB family carbohydrate kinase [Nocardioides immobilis]|uniref:PfkB family carbohydrate kinase n=1 Tax=Nocardioides immobilis TaxID=2049295 RepID=UPI001FEAE69A|nr:PfkB family carbohydrate kinase [Nocardioides immobilis]
MISEVVVVGGANVDVKARSAAAPLAGTSNPGSTRITPGGVGRNIAETLARLGTPTRLVAAVGDDALGDQLLTDTAAAGVDMTGVHRLPALATGTYTAVLSPEGELAVAVADMAATDALAPEHLPDDLLADAALLVVDGNLAAATIGRALDLAAAATVPVVVEPVSVPKAARLRPLLGRPVRAITPNHDELVALTGEDGTLDERIDRLHQAGAELVWVRLGLDGSVLSGPDGRTRLASIRADVVDVTGAGDAMLAAFCHALLGGATPAHAAAYGHAAAALTVASDHTVRPDLTDRLVGSLL